MKLPYESPNRFCSPTPRATSPSGEETVASWVGEFGFVRSRLQPAIAIVAIASAAAPARRVEIFRITSPRSVSMEVGRKASVGDSRTDRPDAGNRIVGEVEAAVGRRLARTLGRLAKQVRLGVVAGVLGPRVQVAAGERQVDAARQNPAQGCLVERVGERDLAELHEAAVLDV